MCHNYTIFFYFRLYSQMKISIIQLPLLSKRFTWNTSIETNGLARFLTNPIAVVSDKRSFLTLKLTENYFSTWSRKSSIISLAVVSIKSGIEIWFDLQYPRYNYNLTPWQAFMIVEVHVANSLFYYCKIKKIVFSFTKEENMKCQWRLNYLRTHFVYYLGVWFIRVIRDYFCTTWDSKVGCSSEM